MNGRSKEWTDKGVHHPTTEGVDYQMNKGIEGDKLIGQGNPHSSSSEIILVLQP